MTYDLITLLESLLLSQVDFLVFNLLKMQKFTPAAKLDRGHIDITYAFQWFLLSVGRETSIFLNELLVLFEHFRRVLLRRPLFII